jgi:hypothetical protein
MYKMKIIKKDLKSKDSVCRSSLQEDIKQTNKQSKHLLPASVLVESWALLPRVYNPCEQPLDKIRKRKVSTGEFPAIK